MLKFPLESKPAQFKDILQRITILHGSLLHLPTTSQQQQYIFHRQILKSSLFSARIEGSTLTLESIEHENIEHSSQKNKIEINNILRAFEHLKDLGSIDLSSVQNIHSLILHTLSSSAGKFRSEVSAIFDQFGTAVYITPDLEDMHLMLEEYLKHLNEKSNSLSEVLINAARCHYYFEKIHPFIDGNGRTGRILMHWQLLHSELFDSYVIPIDQYFDENRSEYYRLLEKNSRNTQEFTHFFLKGIQWSLEKILVDIKSIPEQTTIEAVLLPRREEVLNIIREHPECTQDFLARRFPTLSSRMISYDLQDLIKKTLIKKHGTTRGAVYSANT